MNVIQVVLYVLALGCFIGAAIAQSVRWIAVAGALITVALILSAIGI